MSQASQEKQPLYQRIFLSDFSRGLFYFFSVRLNGTNLESLKISHLEVKNKEDKYCQ